MIEFHDVCVCYEPQKRHPVQSLDGLTLHIERGDWVFLVGPSGAGKSSLLKLIFAGTRAQSGRIIVDGEDITAISHREVPNLRRKIGIVFQDFQLLNEKTAWENVAFTLRVIGTPQSVIVREVPRALETVGLTHRAEAYPHELSGGEQQRIAIARAIVNDPKILLADEPTGNLDPQTAHEVGELLTKINRERGTTIVMATHDRVFVDTLARRVVRLNAGRVVKDEDPGTYGESDGAAQRIMPRDDAFLPARAPSPQSEAPPVRVPAPLLFNHETSAEEVRIAADKAKDLREAEALAIQARAAEKQAAQTRVAAEAKAAEMRAVEIREAEVHAAEAKVAEERAAEAKVAQEKAEQMRVAAERAAQERVAAEAAVRAEEVRVAAAKAAEIRAAEIRAAEIRAAELRAAEVREAEIRAAEVREAEIKMAQAREAQRQAVEARAAEAKAAESRAAEIRAAEERALQTRAREAQERSWQQPSAPAPSYAPPSRETAYVVTSEPSALEYSTFDQMLEESKQEAEAPARPPQFVPASGSWVAGNVSPEAYDSYDDPALDAALIRPMARRIAPSETPPPPPSAHPLDPHSFVSDPDAPLGSPENPIVQYE